MRDFIGINTRASDDIGFIQKFGFVREYHEWSDDAGFDTDGIPNCPQNLLSFRPSNNEATLINYDDFYAQLSGRVSPSMKWLAPEMRGLQGYNPVIQEQKPICGNISAAEQENAASYFDYTKWVSIMVARYGASDVCADPQNPLCDLLKNAVIDGDATGEGVSGLNNLKYIEPGNEPDKWWFDSDLRNTPNALWQMMPQQYAALLHAVYDGGGKSKTFSLSPAGTTYLGVKNIDDQIKVAMGGLSDFRGRYIIEMLEKAYALRAPDPGIEKKLPFDILNIHHYTGTNPNTGAAYINNNALWNTYDYYGLTTGGSGLSPEQCQLKKRYERFLERLFMEIPNPAIKNELTQIDFWLSEFGYDTNNNSEIKAKLTQNGQSYFTTQAQWLVRAFLELSAVEYDYAGQKIVLDKAAAYDLRDHAPHTESSDFSTGGWLFSHCGLLTKDFKPKRAWYYVQNLKNALGDTKFTKDLNPAGDIQFDNGGAAPRIFYYKGAGNTRMLAIWSPTSAKVTDRHLTLPVADLIAKIGEPGFDNIESYTVIRMQDHSENGFRQGFEVADGQLIFNSGTMTISETPGFVLLGQNISDPIVQCPMTGTPSATAYCDGAFFEWDADASPGSHWKVFYAEKNKLPYYADCQGYKNTDLLGNGFVRTYSHDLQGDRKRLLIEGLKPNTNYVAFFVYVSPEGIAAQEPCVICFSTNNNPPPVLNPCCKLEATGKYNPAKDDFCKLAVENSGAALNIVCSSSAGDYISGNPQAVITCNTYDAASGCGASYLYPESQLWTSCNLPEVAVTFENALRLDAIKWYHRSGISHVDIYYATCENPGEKVYLSTFRPVNCNRWVTLFDNLPAKPVKKLFFQKVAAKGKTTQAKVSIGKLHFYGDEVTDCGKN